MDKKFKTLIKDTVIFALGSIGSKFITFLLVPLYTNCLTTEQFGIADLVFTVAQLIVPIISLVIFDAVVRFGLQKENQRQNVLLNGIIIWGAGAVLCLALLPLTNFYTAISEWKWYLYLYVIFEALLSIELNYLKVKQKNINYAIISIAQTLCIALLNILCLVVLKIGIQGYLISTVVAMGIAVVLAMIFGGVLPDLKSAKFDKKLFAQMIKYSSPLIFNNLAWWIIQSSNKMVIEYALGAEILGLFTVAARIPSLINVAVSVFQQAWGISSVVEMDSTNDTTFYSDVLKVYAFIVFAACIALNTIIKPFMRIYVGEEFFAAWQYVPLLVSAAVFSAISAYFGSMYGALKKSMNNMISTVLSALINFGVNVIFIGKIGVWGAVVGTVVAYVFLAAFRLFDVKRFVAIKVDFLKLILNSVLVLAHATLVALDFYAVAFSIGIILSFVVINFQEIKTVLTRIIPKKKDKEL